MQSCGPRIVRVEILNPILGKTTEVDKLAVLDILAIDEHGRRLNIEMQLTLPAGMSRRLTYYTARLYVDQLTEAARYSTLRPVISICVLSKAMFPDTSELHRDFQMRDTAGRLLTDDLQIHLLELPKLRVSAENVHEASPIEQWAYFLRNAENLSYEDIERMFPAREFTEAAGVLEMISRTPEQQMLYNARLKFQMDEAAKLEYAREEGREQALREGEEKGRAEGEAKGRVEGEATGIRKGELLGRIKTLQELLSLVNPNSEELLNHTEAQLIEFADELQRQLRNRGQ